MDDSEVSGQSQLVHVYEYDYYIMLVGYTDSLDYSPIQQCGCIDGTVSKLAIFIQVIEAH